jgi:uncharacterized protein YdaU (DUF1376 family)
MNVNEEDFPEHYRPVIRRLQAAIQSKDMRTKMQVEDDFLRELNDYEFRIESAEKRAEEEQRLRKEAEQKAKAAEQKAEQERREKEAAEQKTIQLQSTLVKILHSQGNSVADISRITGLSVAEIEQILVI